MRDEQAQLETTIRELTTRLAALERTNTALQARIDDLDAFAHTVAHDLKSPLSLISSYAQIVLENYPHMPAADLEADLSAILQTCFKMGDIIEALILLATARGDEIEPRPLVMAKIVDQASARLAPLIESSSARLDLPDRWPAALGYGPWVEEVWYNYLQNAIKHGGQPPVVQLGAERQDDRLIRFWVRDNGPGLDETEPAQLFTEFRRGRRVQATGHGLGLSIVRRIIDKLGGTVGAAGTAGQGSTFWFTLPAADQAG